MKQLANIESLDAEQRARWFDSDSFMLVVLCSAVLLRLAGASTAGLSYALIAAYALLGRRQVVQALMFSWLLTMMNVGVALDDNGSSIGRYIVIICASISVLMRNLGRNSLNIKKVSFTTFCLGVFVFSHSIVFSAQADVSMLKILIWVIVVLTLMSAWNGLSNIEHNSLFLQLEKILLLLVLLSIPLIFVPAIGYMRNGVGFQGLLNHPQSFGPTVAILASLVGGRMMGDQTPSWRDILLFMVCVVFVVLSGARTAGIALVLGLTAAIFFCPIFARKPRRILMPGFKSKRIQSLLFLSIFAIVLLAPILSSQLSAYLFKNSDATSLLGAAEASRGELVQDMLRNISAKPFAGIGFGIASHPEEMEVERDSTFGLPLSAIVEKGVLPIAVVEELGIFGAALVLAWVLMVLSRGARFGVKQFSVLMTLLLVNFGESMLFSVGGMGLVLLIFLAGAITGRES